MYTSQMCDVLRNDFTRFCTIQTSTVFELNLFLVIYFMLFRCMTYATLCSQTSDDALFGCFHSICSTETSFLCQSVRAETVLYSNGCTRFVSEDTVC